MKTATSLKTLFRKDASLEGRIARIVSPNVVELEAKRNARFGRLNVAPHFDLIASIAASDRRGDIRAEFARRIAAGAI